nr:hypothetical protein [Tanacetum cinerariifolium]
MSDDRVFCHPYTCERYRRNYTNKFCSICYFESGNAFIDDLIANSFDDLPNSSDHPLQHQTHSFEPYNDNRNYGYPPQEPFVYNQDSCYEHNFVDNSQSPPQPQYETYSCELCRNDAHYGYDCPSQVLEFLKKYPIAITPVLPTEEPDNSLSMGDEHLSTILKMELDKIIKSSVENLVPIPNESEGISDDTCDVPFCDNSPPLDVLTDFELFSEFNDDCSSSDDDYFEDINYVEASPPDSELFSLEESPSSSFLYYLNNSLLEFETFSDHTKETSSGSTTTHADNSLLEYDLFLFEIEPDQGELSRVVMEAILGEPRVYVPNVLPTHPTICSNIDTSLLFSSKNKDKVFNPGILSSLLLSHRGRITSDFSESPIMISGGDIPSLDVPFLHFYPR